nr:uncharacterized mitochondrial protein AtMg00810-like [Tanacetum cinerariifolium]
INNSSNEVNAAGSSISDAELNFTNSTNVFSVTGPSNVVVPNLEDLSHNADDVKQKKDRIFISQDKYVAEILKKFGLFEGKSASTPIDAEKPLLKDSNGKDVDVHTHIGL